MARPERFELPTSWFVARRSIQLSYGRMDKIKANPAGTVQDRTSPASGARILPHRLPITIPLAAFTRPVGRRYFPGSPGTDPGPGRGRQPQPKFCQIKHLGFGDGGGGRCPRSHASGGQRDYSSRRSSPFGPPQGGRYPRCSVVRAI
jgi:hypothetical protein